LPGLIQIELAAISELIIIIV